ncbi:MAG: MBL fold metallo-hydrolase [Halarsenatibacteraceae bacterium]
MQIKILVANKVNQEKLIAEHGLAFWIKYNQKKYLFDTGQKTALFHNAAELDIPLQAAAAVILSHPHYDHMGALVQLLAVNKKMAVYGHQKIEDELLKTGSSQKLLNFNPVTEPTEIAPGLWLTGRLPDKYLDKVKDHKYYQAAKHENSLFMETAKGLIVLTGCSHGGIVSILKYINEISDQNIYGLAGGFHLIDKNQAELAAIAGELNKMNLKKIYPLHCTGFIGQKYLLDNCQAEVEIAGAGEDIFN